MPKRKRDDDATNGSSTSQDYRRQRQIVHTFEESAKQLARAFKLAKGFERQKLGRRKKQAANEKGNGDHTKDLERIDAEITALKTLDPFVVAEHYLAKSLLKVKAVATSSSVLPEPVRDAWNTKAAAAQTDPATLNVTARLCNSKPVKDSFPTVWAGITRELGIEVEEAVGPGRTKKRLRAKDFADAQARESGDGEESEWEGIKADEDERTSEDGQENGGGEGFEDEFAEFQNRLASSSDDGFDDGDVEDGEDGEDVEDLERQLEAEGISRKASGAPKATYDLAADLSLSDSQSDAVSASPEPQKAGAPKKSAFLPSLTMGGYISGSGSDLEDDEVDVAPRKNRRGQRARQQIWEKKYGTHAKHLQSQDRKKGWDPKRGATDGRERGKKGYATLRGGRHAGAAMPDAATGANAFAVQQPRKRDDTGPLHPSWQAAKRAKEMKNAQVVFQGKKISFD